MMPRYHDATALCVWCCCASESSHAEGYAMLRRVLVHEEDPLKSLPNTSERHASLEDQLEICWEIRA